jgi:hypothetical protein
MSYIFELAAYKVATVHIIKSLFFHNPRSGGLANQLTPI